MRISFSSLSGLSLSILAFATAACTSGTLTGKVAGDEVPAFASSMVAATVTGDDKAFGRAVFAGFDNACGVMSEVSQVEGRDADDIAAIMKEKAPADHWALSVDFARLALSATGQFIGERVDLADPGAIDLSIVLCHQTDFATSDDDNTTCFQAVKGEASVTYQEDGNFEVDDSAFDLFDSDGNQAGEVTFSGSASDCPGAVKLLEAND